jgi:putative addiction module component (TIGR02574 family)
MILDKVPDVQRLTRDEKWQLIDELWGQLLPPPGERSQTEIAALLEERMEEYRRDPSQGVPWAEAKARLRAARGA